MRVSKSILMPFLSAWLGGIAVVPALLQADPTTNTNPAQTEVQRLENSLAALQKKRLSAEDKLGATQRVLATKQSHLTELKQNAGAAPSDDVQANLNNEARRLALAELDVKFAQDEIDRIDSRAADLRRDIAKNRSAIEALPKPVAISNGNSFKDQEAKNQSIAMEHKMAVLLVENERLRREAETARKTAEAATLAAQQLRQKEAEIAAKATVDTQTKAVVKLHEGNQTPDLSQVVLEGEPPIYKDSDTIRLTMRSRSISRPVDLKPIGPNVYQADVTVDPGKAFFDLRNRRYRGMFEGQKNQQVKYRFFYDLNGEKPVLSVLPVNDPTQMISNTKDPF